MGVYINMEMPESCSVCLFSKLSPTGETIICAYSLSTVPWDGKPFDCPLIEIPPHGDLIDRDAYEFPGDLMDEPVIIPAEEVET